MNECDSILGVMEALFRAITEFLEARGQPEAAKYLGLGLRYHSRFDGYP